MGGLLPKPVTRKEIEEQHLKFGRCFVSPPRRFDGIYRNPRRFDGFFLKPNNGHDNGSKGDIPFTKIPSILNIHDIHVEFQGCTFILNLGWRILLKV